MEQVVVGFRATGALSQRGRGHLERARSLIARTESLGGVLVGWSGLALCFAFGVDRVANVVELLSTPADDTLSGEEPWACAIAQGALEPLAASSSRGHLAWGPPLMTTMSLLNVAEPGELLVCDSVRVPERALLVGLAGRPALDVSDAIIVDDAELVSGSIAPVEAAPPPRKPSQAMPPPVPLPSKSMAAPLPRTSNIPPPMSASGPASSASRAGLPKAPAPLPANTKSRGAIPAIAPVRPSPSRTQLGIAVPPLSSQSRTMVAVTAPKVTLTPDEIISLLLSPPSESIEMLERVEGAPSYADRIRALARIKKGDLHEAVRMLRAARATIPPAELGERCRTSLALGFALLASARPEEALLEACDALARAREKIDMRAENAAIGLITKIFDGSGRYADVRAIKAWKSQGGQRAL